MTSNVADFLKALKTRQAQILTPDQVDAESEATSGDDDDEGTAASDELDRAYLLQRRNERLRLPAVANEQRPIYHGLAAPLAPGARKRHRPVALSSGPGLSSSGAVALAVKSGQQRQELRSDILADLKLRRDVRRRVEAPPLPNGVADVFAVEGTVDRLVADEDAYGDVDALIEAARSGLPPMTVDPLPPLDTRPAPVSPENRIPPLTPAAVEPQPQEKKAAAAASEVPRPASGSITSRLMQRAKARKEEPSGMGAAEQLLIQ
jgi:hypothetical protein